MAPDIYFQYNVLHDKNTTLLALYKSDISNNPLHEKRHVLFSDNLVVYN
jgi:hypothetical protein